ncbi:MAG: hypothetical protein Q9223_005954 [Gallowayella weberi]
MSLSCNHISKLSRFEVKYCKAMDFFKRATITDVTYSPINSILTWLLLISAFLAVLVKILLKIFGAAESAAASIQILNGVGRPLESLTAHQIDMYQKAGYASELLYIISLALSKISVLILLRQITPVKNARLDNPPKVVSNITGTEDPKSLGQACAGDGAQVFAGQAPQIQNMQFEGNRAVAEAISPDEYWDTGSQSSQANIIRTTREWIVDYDDRSRHVGPA